MNLIRHSSFVIRAFALLAVFFATAVHAADTRQPGRFLLVFETSPVLKKNLPAVRQTLGRLFVSNLQNELHSGDDVAVWTLDQKWHAGLFQTESWAPEAAALYTERLANFVEQQNFTRHASLDDLQPMLDRVVKSSEHLTVLIFCDTKSRLSGTPYDSDINQTITNVAKVGGTFPLILVLRSYRGEYVGGTVNQLGPLKFPKFPPPPKPAPPSPVASKPATVPALRQHPVQLPPLIIIGTNTHTSASVKPADVSAPTPAPPPANAPAANATLTMTPASAPPPAPTPEPATVAAQPANSVPAETPAQSPPSQSSPAPIPAPRETPSSDQTTVSTTPAVAPANPPTAQPSNTLASVSKDSATEPLMADAASRWTWFAGGAGVVAVAVLVIWLFARARRPHSSLITSSMQDRLPPK